MHLAGIIVIEPPSPRLDEAAWLSVVKEFSELVWPEPQKVRNPFTGKRESVRPSVAHLMVRGRRVGSFEWGHEDGDWIRVWGELSAVQVIAGEIAARLGASFRPTNLPPSQAESRPG